MFRNVITQTKKYDTMSENKNTLSIAIKHKGDKFNVRNTF